MGFIEAFSRMIAGKPVFTDETAARSDTTQTDTAVTPPQNPKYDAHGYKIIPEVHISHIHSHRDGEHMTVAAWVENNSEQAIRIDFIRVLNQKQQFDHELSPHGSHEFIVYQGPTPHNDSDHKAELVFRLMSNSDQFNMHLFVGYEGESDGGYLIDELRTDGPVRDI